MYSNYHRIIKYVAFKPIHLSINLDAVSSTRVFREFDYVFSIECIASLN